MAPPALAPIAIANAGEVLSTLDLKPARLNIVAPRFAPETVIRLAHESGWPAEIATFDRRNTGGGAHPMQGLVGYRAGTVDGSLVLMLVPRAENANARFAVTHDFFVVLNESGVAPRGHPAGFRPPSPPLPPVMRLPPLRIGNAGEVMSTYDFAGRSMTLLDPQHFSVDTVRRLAHENQWPSDIATFDSRMRFKERRGVHPMQGLVGYRVGTLDDGNVVMLVPRSENTNATVSLGWDFFVAIKPGGVSPR
ncbi:MAG: hypothetical protein HY985_11610 [Magnetospirillum sp.]|nr:hypothetical protein [Magnetospirillum sp.]